MQGAVKGAVAGAVQGAVQGCCPGCSGSCLPLGGVRVLSRVSGSCLPLGGVRVLSRVLSGCSGSCLPLGGVRVLSRVLRRGAVQGAPDHVCHWAVSGCCPGCCAGVLFRVLPGLGSCLPLGGVRVLSRVLCRGAVQGAPDHVCQQGAVQGAVRPGRC